jgi:hypothetical protein
VDLVCEVHVLYEPGCVIPYVGNLAEEKRCMSTSEFRTDVCLKYDLLAKIPGVARDSIRNEGTQEINYGITKIIIICQGSHPS